MAETKPVVVLADDEAQYTLSYGLFLEDLGFEVRRATTRRELLGFALSATVLVVDACLPSVERMEGIEAIAELLDESQTGGSRIAADVPIIFLSGYREDTPLVREKLRSYPILAKRGYRWVWKDDEFEVLSDAIYSERRRLTKV
jgi:CheY-like chemotaxis protein